MTNNGVTVEQAAAVTPLNLREYALASGWRRVQSRRPERIILAREGSPDQLIFPNDPSFDDYGQTIYDVIIKLASIEDRPVPEVYTDVLSPDADNVRAGVISPPADRGQIDLDFAIRLLAGFRESLVAAAHSVITPLKRHPKLNRADALEMVKRAKLNHSERSSYTVSVTLPLRAVDDPLPGGRLVPFTRRTTELFMRSVHRLYSSIENDAPEQALAENSNEPLISANLCDGLLKMQPADERGELRLAVQWAPTLPAPNMQAIPRSVRFRRDHFERIADIYTRLLPGNEPRPQLYAGTVERLAGYIGVSGRREGDVDLNLFHEDEIIVARANLNADMHASADRAYMNGDIVLVHGQLERRPRVSLLNAVSQFEVAL